MPAHAHSSSTPAPCRPPNPPYHLAPPQIPNTATLAGASDGPPARKDGPSAAELPGFGPSPDRRPKRITEADPDEVGEA